MLELETKQIFRFALVPVGRVNLRADTGHRPDLQRHSQNTVNPSAPWHQEDVAEIPLVALLDNQTAEGTSGFPKKKLA